MVTGRPSWYSDESCNIKVITIKTPKMLIIFNYNLCTFMKVLHYILII